MYVIPTNKAQWHAIGARLGVVAMWVNRSYSTGEIRLTSKEASSPPDIDFNMCSDERDMARLVMGVKLLAKLGSHPAVKDAVEEVFPISFSERAHKLAVRNHWNALQTFIGAQAMDASALVRRAVIRAMIADAPSVDDLVGDEDACRAWIRSAVLGHWHASCTCRMGRADDPLAVTDASARVIGVEGLRIADASIMPSVPCANTNLPTIMIGEKVAAMALDQR
jgi:5-(hydroxymethyl)furfural/furfural oxidase